jgi:chitinase
VVAAYVPSWEPTTLVGRLPGQAVTHLLYAFLRICGPGQLPADEARCAGKGAHQLAAGPTEQRFDEAFQRLKARAPQVKVLASVGGWGGSDPFFHFANDAAGRARFAASVADFLRRHPGFDGVDIDWEHPTSNGSANGVALGSAADGRGYAELMHSLRRTLDALGRETGRSYLVTTAINTAASLVDKIDYRDAARSLDLVFMMSYDFYGPWTPTAGHHTALRSRGDGGDDSVAAGLRNLQKAGLPRDKLVVGVAMYGRGFTGVAAPAAGAGFNGARREGVYAGTDGSMTYREIAASHLDPAGQPRAGWHLVAEPELGAWALWNPAQRLYMGYDDPRAVWRKGRFVLQEGLAGVFAWELSQDNGDLLNAMNLGLGHLPRTPP